MPSASTIFLAEGDSVLAEFLAEILGEEGYSVRTVFTGAQIRAAIAAELPDLLLCNEYLPDISGSALIADLRCNGLTDIPVVILTTNTRTEQVIAASWLTMPLDLDNFLDYVATNIAHTKRCLP